MLRLAVLGLAATAVVTQSRPRLASQLREGMRIDYAAEGNPPSSWPVGKITRDDGVRPGADCVRYVMQKGPTPGSADSLFQCVAGDTLFTVSKMTGILAPLRPVGPNMKLEIRRANGGSLIETGAMAADTIGGTIVPVVVTTYTIRGPNGQAIQQLRERFAVSLGTATRGAFYEADPSAAGGWTLQRSFRIAKITQP
jgi:hypothetical protein